MQIRTRKELGLRRTTRKSMTKRQRHVPPCILRFSGQRFGGKTGSPEIILLVPQVWTGYGYFKLPATMAGPKWQANVFRLGSTPCMFNSMNCLSFAGACMCKAPGGAPCRSQDQGRKWHSGNGPMAMIKKWWEQLANGNEQLLTYRVIFPLSDIRSLFFCVFVGILGS